MNTMRWLLLLMIGLVFFGFFWFDLGNFLSLASIKEIQAQFNGFIKSHFLLTITVFFAIYVLVTGLSLPGAALLTLLAGSLFGLLWGTVIVSFASTIGASLAFLIARFLFREQVQMRFADKLQSINQGIEKEGKNYLFTLRLIPIFPFFVINLVMGLTPIKLWPFFWVSQMGMLPGTLVYVNAGTALANIDSLQGIVSFQLLASFALLGCFPYLIKFVLHRWQTWRKMRAYVKPKVFDRNLIVIGGGSGGLVSAYIAAAVRAKVTLIEKNKMGGDCLNTGCVPSKALIHCAKLAAQIHKGSASGIEVDGVRINFAKVMAQIQAVIEEVKPHDSVERYTKLGVECIHGQAQVISPWEVEVNGQRLSARHLIIATGASPLIPPIPGLADIPYFTSDNIWSLRHPPEHLLVLGGGPIGCELAQSFARLGIRVTQVELAAQLLPREDADVAQVVQQALKKDGVHILTGWKAVQFNEQQGRYAVTLSQGEHSQELVFDQMLLALGRVAHVRGFGLENLGIELTERGTLAVNEYLQTSIPTIFAVGDVAGPYQFTHFSAHQAWYATVNSLFGGLKRFATDYRIIPATTFTEPQVARVGLNEKEANAANIMVEITCFEIAELDRAIAERAKEGFIKVLTPPDQDTILGATIVGALAGEMIAEFVLAMRHGLGLNKILSTIHAYPTWMEANKYVAGQWKQAHKPKRVLNILERYHRWQRKSD